MNVSTESIRAIKPGTIQPFICENALALGTASYNGRFVMIFRFKFYLCGCL